MSRKLAVELFRDDLFGSHLKKEFMLLARIEIRQKIYSPVKVLRMMDLKGGQVNYAGVGALHEIDLEGVKYFRHAIAVGPCCSKMVAQTYDDHTF
jgi:hypothetical protein